MGLNHPKYKDKKTGKTKECKTWLLNIRDHNGIVQRWGLGTAVNECDAVEIESQIKRLINFASPPKSPPPDDLIDWVREQNPKLRAKIYDAKLLEPEKASDTKTVAEHLEAYRKFLTINRKERYTRKTISQITKIIEGCNFKNWRDVDGEKINEYMLNRTENDICRHSAQVYIRSFRLFCKWLKKKKRIIELPEIENMNYEETERRAFEYDEWDKLLEATREAPERSKMSGWTRYVLYRLSMEHGLRLDEAAKLTASSFNLSEHTIFIKGTKTKGSTATQKMREEITALIKELIVNKTPQANVFSLTKHAPEMLRKDCEDAGIEITNQNGTIVFHSLRHTCATFLLNQGKDIKIVQARMRHAKVETTLRYAHRMIGSDSQAVNAFENISKRHRKKKIA